MQLDAFERCIVHIDQSDKLLIALYKHTLVSQRVAENHILYLFRIHILTIRTKQHILLTSAYEDESFAIDSHQVARMEPTVSINGLSCRFWVLVVACHHVGSSYQQFAWVVLRIVACHLHLHSGYNLSARTDFAVCMTNIANQRSTLRHAVARSIWQLDCMQEFIHLSIHCSTTEYHFDESTTEELDKLLADLVIDNLTNARNSQQELHLRRLQRWEHLVLDDFLHDEWNGHYEERTHVSKCLQQHLWAWDACEQIDRTTCGHRVKELDREAVHVSHRKD